MPVVEHKGDYPVRVSIPAQSFKKSFADAEAVSAFLKHEQEAWNELMRLAPQVPQLHQEILQLAGQRAVQRAVNDFRGKSVLEASAAFNRIESEGAVLWAGKWGRGLRLVMEQNPLVAASAAFAISSSLPGSVAVRESVQWQSTMSTEAAIAGGLAALLEAAAHDAPRRQFEELVAETQSLNERMSREIVKHEADLSGALQATENDLKGALENLNSQVTATAGSFQQRLNDADQKLTKTIELATESLEEFKRKVRQDVVSEVPTTFWQTKAVQHRNTALLFGLLFLAVAGGGVWWLTHGAVDTFVEATTKIVALSPTSPFLALVPLAFVTLPALAFAWVLRHISRVLIQNISLEADARLRSTITSTFRALAADRSMSEAELAIALQALFRPIDGKDHSDIAPPSIADIIKLNDKS